MKIQTKIRGGLLTAPGIDPGDGGGGGGGGGTYTPPPPPPPPTTRCG
ncbi:MAG TPA: hypothetical protein VGH20_16500 [Myxococcales bacterium]|jgi:hypothetical protein